MSGTGSTLDLPAWEDDIVWPDPAPPGDADLPPPDRVEDAAAMADPLEQALAALRLADRALAEAVRRIRNARQERTAVRTHGVPLGRLLGLLADRTGTDVRFICRAEQRLAHMPAIDGAFAASEVSWSQVRGIVTATDGMTVNQTGELDTMLSAEVGRGEPDRIVQRAFGLADQIRWEAMDAAQKTPPDPGEHRQLWMQPDLLGGADLHLYDTLDAVTTVFEAAAAAADPPQADRDRDEERPFGATPRRAQLAEGLRRVAAGTAPTGSRPAVSVVVDHTDLQGPTARMLTAWYGGPVRLHPTTTDRTLCDAALDAVVVQDHRPVAVGDAFAPVTARHRRILAAVDRGCRMPGCTAPPQHCDAHHVIPRMRAGPTTIDNLILLCRPCHVRLHHHRLDLTLDPRTRAITLTLYDGRTLSSLPV